MAVSKALDDSTQRSQEVDDTVKVKFDNPLENRTRVMKVSHAAALGRYGLRRFINDRRAAAAGVPIAEAFVTMRTRDGVVLEAQDEDVLLPIASLTKLRTATLVRVLQCPLDEAVNIDECDFISRSSIFQPGDIVSIHTLISAMMLQSDNVAAQTLARINGVKTFVEEMNDGGVGTFVNSWGGGIASARNVATMMISYQEDAYLLRRALDTYYRTVVGGPNERVLGWKNRVASRSRIPGFIWGKTGTSDFRASLGFSWEYGGTNHITVILRSAGNRFRDGRIMVERTFSRLGAVSDVTCPFA